MLQQVKLESIYMNGGGGAAQSSASSTTSSSASSSSSSSAVSSSSGNRESGERGNTSSMAGGSTGLVDMNNNQIGCSHSPKLHNFLQQYYSTMPFGSPYANLIGIPPPPPPPPPASQPSSQQSHHQQHHHHNLSQPPPSSHQYGQLDPNFYLLQQNRTTATPSMSSNSMNGGSGEDVNQCDYLQKLLEERDKLKELINEPFNIFLPVCTRFIEEEINRIRVNLFQLGNKDVLALPEPLGPVAQITEKIYVPVKDHPEFNFVGRILGPRGMTAKQLEQETGCKIMVRGKGSMRDKAKEDQMKGKPNWEHLNDELHVLITVEDTKNRAEMKIKRAIDEIKKLLVPAPEGEDELKKKQLMELAIINGTYRDGNKLIQQKLNQILIPNSAVAAAAAAAAANNPYAALMASISANNNAALQQLRSPPHHLGQPLILSPRPGNGGQNGNHPGLSTTLINGTQYITTSQDPNAAAAAAAAAAGLYAYATIPTANLQTFYQTAAGAAGGGGPTGTPEGFQTLEYPGGIDISQAGAIKQQRFPVNSATAAQLRAHPYARVAL